MKTSKWIVAIAAAFAFQSVSAFADIGCLINYKWEISDRERERNYFWEHGPLMNMNKMGDYIAPTPAAVVVPVAWLGAAAVELVGTLVVDLFRMPGILYDRHKARELDDVYHMILDTPPYGYDLIKMTRDLNKATGKHYSEDAVGNALWEGNLGGALCRRGRVADMSDIKKMLKNGMLPISENTSIADSSSPAINDRNSKPVLEGVSTSVAVTSPDYAAAPAK